MSMPTPSNHRLPQPPHEPPRKSTEGSPTNAPTETSSVLERLRAARPKAGGSSGEETPGMTTAADRSAPTEAPGQSPPEPADPGSGPGEDPQPASADAESREKAHREKLRAARADKLRAASAAASTWAVNSGKRTAAWTATASRGAARNVRSWKAELIRQTLVTLTVTGALAATAYAAGLLGEGPGIWTADLLAPNLTLVSPNLSSLYIWVLIGLGMVGYVVHQWLPSQAHNPRHIRLGWVVMASLLLNLALALTIQADLYAASVVLHGLLLTLLMVSLRWLNRWSAATRLEGALVDVPLGLFLGWTGFTALSHTAAVLSLNGFSWLTEDEFVWALVGLGIVVIVGSVVCSTDRGRIAVALALVWGLVWVMVERVFGQPASLPTAAATALAVFIVLITAGSRRHRVDHSYRRALRRRQTANLPPINLANEDDDDYYEDEDELRGDPGTERKSQQE